MTPLSTPIGFLDLVRNSDDEALGAFASSDGQGGVYKLKVQMGKSWDVVRVNIFKRCPIDEHKRAWLWCDTESNRGVRYVRNGRAKHRAERGISCH